LGIDAYGVGFETRRGAAHRRGLSERGGVGFETRPDGCAVGRDLSERMGATSASGWRGLSVGGDSREGVGRWGGCAQGCPTRGSPNWRPA